MRLARGRGSAAVIPLTPLVDVMLILLVFFMVTSTYLDLDMVPMGEGGEAPGASAATAADAPRQTVLLRIDASGRLVYRGQPLGLAGLGAALASRPGARVLILPSGVATAQDLVSVMEAVARAGIDDARIVRVEGTP